MWPLKWPADKYSSNDMIKVFAGPEYEERMRRKAWERELAAAEQRLERRAIAGRGIRTTATSQCEAVSVRSSATSPSQTTNSSPDVPISGNSRAIDRTCRDNPVRRAFLEGPTPTAPAGLTHASLWSPLTSLATSPHDSKVSGSDGESSGSTPAMLHSGDLRSLNEKLTAELRKRQGHSSSDPEKRHGRRSLAWELWPDRHIESVHESLARKARTVPSTTIDETGCIIQKGFVIPPRLPKTLPVSGPWKPTGSSLRPPPAAPKVPAPVSNNAAAKHCSRPSERAARRVTWNESTITQNGGDEPSNANKGLEEQPRRSLKLTDDEIASPWRERETTNRKSKKPAWSASVQMYHNAMVHGAIQEPRTNDGTAEFEAQPRADVKIVSGSEAENAIESDDEDEAANDHNGPEQQAQVSKRQAYVSKRHAHVQPEIQTPATPSKKVSPPANGILKRSKATRTLSALSTDSEITDLRAIIERAQFEAKVNRRKKEILLHEEDRSHF